MRTDLEVHRNARSLSVLRRSKSVKRMSWLTFMSAIPRIMVKWIRSSKREERMTAMREEIQALEENKVLRLVKRSFRSNALHNNRVFKMKTNAYCDLARLKARLFACGNEQVFGVAYQLTFAAVMDMATVKVLLALSAPWGVPAKFGHIPNAYVKANKESHL